MMESNLKVKKYFYEDDISILLFKGNGIGLSASLLAMSKIVPNQTFDPPIFSSLLYFAGIVFAFFVHYINWHLNNDMRQRERRDNALIQIELLRDKNELTSESRLKLDNAYEAIIQSDKNLLSTEQTIKFKSFQGWSYISSSLCFFISTSLIILFLYNL